MASLLFFFLITITAIPQYGRCRNSRNETDDGDKCGHLPTHLSESNITSAVFDTERFKHWERPVLNANESIGVKLILVIRDVTEVNERNQQVKLNGFMRIFWYDQFHRWNETWPHSCIENVVVPHGKKSGVWIPDVAFTSSDHKYELTHSPWDVVRIRSDGLAAMCPGTLFDFQCQFNLALFPYDVQMCALTFESWMLQMPYQHFEEPEIQIDAYHNSANQEWDLLPEGRGRRENGTYPTGEWDWVIFDIKLKRKPGYYALTIILPCLLIAVVEIVTFAIPFDKSVRLEVSFTSLLAYSMFQSIMTDQMPHSANNPPLLLILISLFTIYIGIAIYLQAIGIFLAGKAADHGGQSPPPRSLLLIGDILAPLVGLPRYSKSPNNNKNGAKSAAWLFIARVADRYFALIFLLLLIITSIVLLIIIPASQNLLT